MIVAGVVSAALSLMPTGVSGVESQSRSHAPRASTSSLQNCADYFLHTFRICLNMLIATRICTTASLIL